MPAAEFQTIAEELYRAPFVLLVHSKYEDNCKFEFTNRAGLEAMDATWDELMAVPSKQAAPPNAAAQVA
jgi:MEKHLA domain